MISFQVFGKTTVVAVIDTGFGVEGRSYDAKLCRFGHKDFTKAGVVYKNSEGTVVPADRHGHGTHIAGLVNKYAKEGSNDYCLVIIKYFDPVIGDSDNVDATLKAIEYATNIHADYINYSGGGGRASPDENSAVKKYLDQGGIFVAAAGNERNDLAKYPYYPAMADDRVIVVGNVKKNLEISPTSNRGSRVNCWEVGTQVEMYGAEMTGTSQSTAIVTGELVAGKTCHKVFVDKTKNK